jgi:hypothetical protein
MQVTGINLVRMPVCRRDRASVPHLAAFSHHRRDIELERVGHGPFEIMGLICLGMLGPPPAGLVPVKWIAEYGGRLIEGIRDT